ncbi:MAG TPA: class I SAM-dependent DNA methyltransferase [Chthoniobacterales bacterium]|nr:class I SAM-dependent DNA methyltransferase [Chthoniobacterales bacterium]
MLSPKLKTDIKKLWDKFWSGGIANPLTAIEQITYLVFLKRLEDLDNQRVEETFKKAASQAVLSDALRRMLSHVFRSVETENFRWSYIKQLPSEERLNHVRGPVFDWLKKIEGAGDRMRDAVFVIPSANLLQSAIEIIDHIFVPSQNQDTLGDIYEFLLSEIAEAGKNGQFRTPRHIIRAMCDLVDPRIGERICDPACGTAGFLVNAYQHILKRHTNRETLEFEADGTPLNAYGDLLSRDQHVELMQNHFHGFDFDRTMVRLGWMNLVLHGMENPKISYADSLGSRFNNDLKVNGGYEGDYDVILANPPFTGSIDKEDIGRSLADLGSAKTELLFVELILQLLRVGGRAAVIVPEGVLFGSTGAHKILREKLVTENQLEAVISLPGGVFQPYTGVKTSILVFTKGGKTDEVWFYEVAADGFSLNARRSPQPEQNDLWDMVLKFSLRQDAHAPQPRPVFLNDSAWDEWRSIDAATRAKRLAQPVIRTETRTSSDGESFEVSLFKGLQTLDGSEPKEWTATAKQIASNDYNLTSGRYKVFAESSATHRAPAEIIRELQSLEGKIQSGLESLLAMVEAEK